MKDYRQEIGFKVRVIHNGIDKYFDKKRKENNDNIPRGQGMTLKYLMENIDRPVYQKDIEDYFSLSGATVTNMLKSLEKNGYIKRVADLNDARLKQIVLTEIALEREERISTDVDKLEEGLRDNFTSEELTIFRQYLDRVIQNIDIMNM